MEYFKLSELTATNTGKSNIPNEQEKKSLELLVKNVLDPARRLFGAPIMVNSGYRSSAVNNAVGGVKNSQHLTGEAADIECSDNAKLYNLIKDNLIYDQLIWEKGNDKQPQWIHVSYKASGNRKQVLRIK